MHSLSVRLLPPENAGRSNIRVALEDCDDDALMDLLNDQEPVRSGSRVMELEQVLELEIYACDEDYFNVGTTGTVVCSIIDDEGHTDHRTCRGPVWRHPGTTMHFCKFKNEEFQSALRDVLVLGKGLKPKRYERLYDRYKNETLTLSVLPSWQ